MRLWVLYQVKSLVPTIENLIGVLCETAAKINYCRLVAVNKTFKKFLSHLEVPIVILGASSMKMFIY